MSGSSSPNALLSTVRRLTAGEARRPAGADGRLRRRPERRRDAGADRGAPHRAARPGRNSGGACRRREIFSARHGALARRTPGRAGRHVRHGRRFDQHVQHLDRRRARRRRQRNPRGEARQPVVHDAVRKRRHTRSARRLDRGSRGDDGDRAGRRRRRLHVRAADASGDAARRPRAARARCSHRHEPHRAAGQPGWRRTTGGRGVGRETSPADRGRARRARRGPRAGRARGGDGRDLSVCRQRRDRDSGRRDEGVEDHSETIRIRLRLSRSDRGRPAGAKRGHGARRSSRRGQRAVYGCGRTQRSGRILCRRRRADVRRWGRRGECGDQVWRGACRAGSLAGGLLQESRSQTRQIGTTEQSAAAGCGELGRARGSAAAACGELGRGRRDESGSPISNASGRPRRSPESRCRSRGRTSAALCRSPAAGGCGRRARGRTSSPSPRSRAAWR